MMKNMIYQSTRNKNLTADSLSAVTRGIAPDGGLYICDPSLIGFDWKAVLRQDARGISVSVLSALLPDFDGMEQLVEKSYENRFTADDLTPVVKVKDRYVLELFRGPTSAFKDVALSVLPHLIAAARKKQGAENDVVILTATSGDTGKAALEGFHDVKGTQIIVFYPFRGTSRIQELQMTTQKGGNVHVCAVRGNFDDAQTGVKKIFASLRPEDLGGRSLSSANSINIGRLAPQVMYYFKAYEDLINEGRIRTGEPVHFVVPTGNFGDILAGYFAKLMGLPIGKLVCASNKNNVLTDFIKTGCYDKRREFYKTTSPSMDILVSSNLERLLWLLSKDEELVAGLMRELSETGVYTIPAEMLAKLQAEFACGCADDERAAQVIGSVFRETGYLMDPHTAVAWAVSEDYISMAEGAPVVVLSTASPFKFPAPCLSALGEKPEENEFDSLKRLEKISETKAPEALTSLENAHILHKDVIEADEMMNFVLTAAEKGGKG